MTRTARRRQHGLVPAAQRGHGHGAERERSASLRLPRREAGAAVVPDVRGRGVLERPVQRRMPETVSVRSNHTSGTGGLCPRQLAGTAEMSPAPPAYLSTSAWLPRRFCNRLL
jgi:hypothetical protein